MDASTPANTATPLASAPTPVIKPPRPLLGFIADLLIGLAVMLVSGVLAGVAWGAWRGAQIAMRGGVDAATLDQAQLTQQLGAPGGVAMLVIVLVSTGSAALVAYFWRRRADRPVSPPVAVPVWRRPPVWGWALGGGAAAFAIAQLANWAGAAGGVELTPTNMSVLESSIRKTPWLVFGFAVLIAPLYEELLFRRVLFARMWWGGRPWLGLVLSSLAFALLHELPGVGGNPFATTALLWLVYAAMGAIFAAVYYRTGSLWTAIGAHATNNLISGVGLFALTV